MSRDVVSLSALLDESRELATCFHRRSVVDYENHVIGKNKWGSVAVDHSSDFLIMTEGLVEINVEHVTSSSDHDVVIVSIPKAENVSRHGISSAGSGEIVDQFKFIVSLTSQPVVQASFFLVVANLHLPEITLESERTKVSYLRVTEF